MKTTFIALALPACLLVLAGPAAAQKADPATVIQMCDTNNDNALTQKEWDACGAPTAYPAAADTNKDGKVTVAELTAAP